MEVMPVPPLQDDLLMVGWIGGWVWLVKPDRFHVVAGFVHFVPSCFGELVLDAVGDTLGDGDGGGGVVVEVGYEEHTAVKSVAFRLDVGLEGV